MILMENGILPSEQYNEWSKTRIEFEIESLETILDHLIKDSGGTITGTIAKTMIKIEQLENLLKEKDSEK